ncbi:unnamed protein product [Phyllotreta striolata]|uniref:Uncharacterized protein n=1 Tax=Phyllotreta striolata TaxID=444603 RepID=A0A9N9TGV1_PHYSR|nr:unnamed protein product [Phyllotreta striolata]
MAKYLPRSIDNFPIIARLASLLLIVGLVAAGDLSPPAEFHQLTQKPPVFDDFKRITFEVRGSNVRDGLRIKATKDRLARNSECKDYLGAPYNISAVKTFDGGSGLFELSVPRALRGDVYLCLPRQVRDFGGKIGDFRESLAYRWYHQGPDIRINVTADKQFDLSLQRRELPQQLPSFDNGTKNTIKILGLRLEHAYKHPDFDEQGVPVILAYKDNLFRIFGEGLTKSMLITFTTKQGDCLFPISSVFSVENSSFTSETALVTLNLPPLSGYEETYYICAKDADDGPNKLFDLQGTEFWHQVKSFDKPIPLWGSIMIIILCLMFSALFSGLNLGLMSLDKTDLKILSNIGTRAEKRYAQAIQPVRNHGNYLLCSILLSNVFINSIYTLFLDDLTSGFIAVIFSTLSIVLIGEIAPQAICSRHGLAIGAKTIYATKFVMLLTFPLAYPVAKILDYILGEEIGSVYNRERLKELIKVTTGNNELDKDEVNIISGALELCKKSVADVMTRIEDVFMLDYEAILDFETVSEIMKSGFSRIPVFEGNRQNIVTMLYIKDLAFVDPDDNTPLKTLCQFYQNPCNFVFEDVTLDVMFKIFKEGNKGHMAFVHRVNNEGEGDPFYETIGLITLEDVIEELIQAEIMDETDVFTDNRSKRKRHQAERRQDFTVFAEKRGEPSKMRISPQLTLAAFQYLSTSVESFNPNVISETILRRLLKQDIVIHIKKNKDWRTDPSNVIFDQGKPVDFFVIILEGRVEVTVGKESLMFEGGPFTYFGTQALVQTVGIESPSVAPSTMGSLESINIDSMLRHTFIPDYTVRASTEVLYLKIKRSLYLAAKRATLMERSKKGENQSDQQFDEEVDKLLHSLDEDDASVGRQTPRRKSTRKSQQEINVNSSTPAQQASPCKAPAPTPMGFGPTQRLVGVGIGVAGDANGSVKSSPIDDIQIVKDDEASMLLPKRT